MRLISIEDAEAGMKLAESIYDGFGRLLLTDGTALTAKYLVKLREIGVGALYVVDADTIDILVPPPISREFRHRALQNLILCFGRLANRCQDLRGGHLEAVRQHLSATRFRDATDALAREGCLHEAIKDADELVQALADRPVLIGLNCIKTHDGCTYQHSIDVTVLAVMLARKAGWDSQRLRAFATGCVLHDIGKIFVDPRILNKADELTPEEYEQVKAHPAIGHDVIRAVAPSLGFLVPQVAHQHHEKHDGSGYPRGLVGSARLGLCEPHRIHDFGAICAVADVYDAMVSDRPGRKGTPPDRVHRYIREASGTHFNPQAVELFLKTVAPYPLATPVSVLAGRYAGYTGIVSNVEERALDCPRIRLLSDVSGRRIAPIEIDLGIDRDIQIACATGAREEAGCLMAPAAPAVV